MKEQLRNWLNGDRNFQTGAALYCMLGENEAMKKLLKKGKTDYLQERLEQELDQLYDQLFSGPPPSLSGPPPLIPSGPAIPKNQALEEVCNNKATRLYKQMMNDRAILFSLAKTEIHEDPNTPDLIEQRRILALAVCEQNYAVSKAYDELDHVRKYGVLTNSSDSSTNEIPEVPDHLLKHHINNLRKNLGKIRKREQTPERLTLIQKHEQELKELINRWDKLSNA